MDVGVRMLCTVVRYTVRGLASTVSQRSELHSILVRIYKGNSYLTLLFYQDGWMVNGRMVNDALRDTLPSYLEALLATR